MPARDALPEPLRWLGPGYHMMPEAMGGALVYVDDQPQGRLLLVFKQTQVNKLAFWFGAVPLAFVLIVIYAIAWMTYRSFASRDLADHLACQPGAAVGSEAPRRDPR